METKKSSGLTTATLVLGLLALLFAVLPLFSGWFLLLMWLEWVLGIAAIVCGIIAFVKQHDPKNVIIGLICTVVAWVLPSVMEDAYIEAALESAAEAAADTYHDSYQYYY